MTHMWDARTATAGVTLGLLLWATASASACSIGTEEKSPRELRENARRVIAEATAIVDGEVVRPFVDGKHNALLRAHTVLKGPNMDMFEIGTRTDCDVALMYMGGRLRAVLEGGPNVYYLPVENLENPTYQDEILGSDRTKDWPYRHGEPPAD
jgi:hypothetical protein